MMMHAHSFRLPILPFLVDFGQSFNYNKQEFMIDTPKSRRVAAGLWFLLALFCGRVIGQALVAFAGVTFLPPMEEWYSGLVPYAYLLVSQLVIIILAGKICLDFTRGRGMFVQARSLFAHGALYFGYFYLAVMVLRYVIRMSLYPSERWLGGIIPIFFHWVLATFVILFGRFHRSRRFAQIRSAGVIHGILLLGILTCCSGCQTILSKAFLPSEGVRSKQNRVRIDRDVQMKTSDGTNLSSFIYRPKVEGKTPTILVRIPMARTLFNKTAADLVGRFWAQRGYTVVLQGTRGRLGSGGEFYPLRTERRDGIETLHWLQEQPWFDGRLGMWGGSAFGYTQWVVGDQHDPGPTALNIQIASSRFYDMFYRGGAFSLESALYWGIRSHDNRDRKPSMKQLAPGFDGFPLIEADDRSGADVPFFNDWVTHSKPDEYWNEIDGHVAPRDLKAPVLLLAGWFDPFLPAQLDDFVRIRKESAKIVAESTRLVIGPWAHARTVELPDGFKPLNYRKESLGRSLPWFDQHLMKIPDIKQTSPVRIFVMGENVWRDEDDWPLARARSTPYYLGSGGTQSDPECAGVLDTEPGPQTGSETYVYDPLDPVPSAGGAMIGPRAGISILNDVEARPDVLVYSSPVLQHDLEVTGPVDLVLYVSTSAPNTDFTAKLVDVHADGTAYNVSDGILRRSYAPDRIEEISIRLWPTSMLFRKGHRVRLEVASSNFPRYDRNLNMGGNLATGVETQTARQTIYYGSAYPSRLILPVVPGYR